MKHRNLYLTVSIIVVAVLSAIGLLVWSNALIPTPTPLAHPTPTVTPGPTSLAPTVTITPVSMTIKVFFGSQDQANISCTELTATQRTVPQSPAVARAALEQLLQGPTEAEKAAGIFTSIPAGVAIQSLTINNGVARVDFNEALEKGVGGSCRVAAIRAQITQTLQQFPTVNNVVISINGRTEDILQP